MGIIIGERDSFGRRLRVARVDKARLSSLSFPGGLSVDEDACFLGAPERERGERGEIVIHHRPPPSHIYSALFHQPLSFIEGVDIRTFALLLLGVRSCRIAADHLRLVAP
jgi:hypothetical protein